jgi:hypothetical protein
MWLIGLEPTRLAAKPSKGFVSTISPQPQLDNYLLIRIV